MKNTAIHIICSFFVTKINTALKNNCLLVSFLHWWCTIFLSARCNNANPPKKKKRLKHSTERIFDRLKICKFGRTLRSHATNNFALFTRALKTARRLFSNGKVGSVWTGQLNARIFNRSKIRPVLWVGNSNETLETIHNASKVKHKSSVEVYF